MTGGFYITFEFDEIREFIQIVIQKKRDALGGVIAILICLFGNLPFIFKVFLILIVTFLLVGIFQEAMKIQKTYKEKHVPIVIVAGRKYDGFSSTISSVLEVMNEYRFDEKSYLEDFDLSREDWTIFREGDLPQNSQEWEKVVHTFETKINRVSEKLKGRKVFHIFLNCPAILAMGMGAIVGTKCEVILHHYAPGAGKVSYHPLIDFYSMCEFSTEGLHTLKSRVNPPYEYIYTEGHISESASLWISIFLAGHDPKGDVEKVVEKLPNPVSVIHLRSKMEGTIPLDANWIQITKEVATELLNVVSKKEVQDVTICLSSPLIIAFALGMAVGTQSPITLKSWFSNSNEYHSVLCLNKLRDSH